MQFLDPQQLHALIRSLPNGMVAREVRGTTIKMADGSDCLLLPIFCVHDGNMVMSLKILIGQVKCQVLHCAFCPHQTWSVQRREGGPSARKNLIRWEFAGEQDTNDREDGAVGKVLKKWAETEFKRCVKENDRIVPMVMEFVEAPSEVFQTMAEGSCRTLEELIGRTPGFFYMVVGSSEGNGKRLVVAYEGGLAVVTMMTWVPLNIDEIVQVIDYTECDATFKSCRPYVAIVIQGVSRNVGLPLCLTIAPSERHVSYEFAYQCIRDALWKKGRKDLADKMFGIPVLSDMGSALATFVDTFGLTQYWCHRHLIERFGAADLLCDVYRLVLASTNWHQANDIVQNFVAKSHDVLEHCDAKTARPLTLAMEKMQKAMLSYEKWSQEVKLSRHHGFVAATTNHAEGFHRHMNAATAKRRHPLTRTMEVLKLIMKKYANFGDSAELNAQRKFDKLVQEARLRVQHGADELEFRRDECTCGKRAVNSYIYGTEFPCLCNILTYSECPVHHVQLKLTSYTCQGEGIIMTPEMVQERFNVEIPREWNFKSSERDSGQMVHSRELDHFLLDLKALPWFTSLRNEVSRKFSLSQDEATWKVVKYFYKRRVEIDRLTPVDMAIHEFEILNSVEEPTTPLPQQPNA